MATPRQLALREKQKKLRTQLFPDVTDAELWERGNKTGFATIPRALPMTMVLMDELSPKKPIGGAYLALWCRAWDDPLVILSSKMIEIALEAGFSGQRAQNSLCGRLAVLEKLGFVRFAPGPAGQYTYALLLNPYLALKKHEKKLSKFNWNALLQRMSEIGADDYDPNPKPRPPQPPQVDLTALLANAGIQPISAPPAPAAPPSETTTVPKPPPPPPRRRNVSVAQN